MNIAMLSDVEQINTMEVNEVLLSILLAAAQEESAAKSEISSLVSVSECTVEKLY